MDYKTSTEECWLLAAAICTPPILVGLDARAVLRPHIPCIIIIIIIIIVNTGLFYIRLCPATKPHSAATINSCNPARATFIQFSNQFNPKFTIVNQNSNRSLVWFDCCLLLNFSARFIMRNYCCCAELNWWPVSVMPHNIRHRIIFAY